MVNTNAGASGGQSLTDAGSRFAFVVASVLALLSVSVLLGWKFDDDRLKLAIAGFIATNPMTAVGFLLAAFSLWALASRIDPMKTGRAAGAVVLGIGLAGITSLVSGRRFGLDEMLFRDRLDVPGALPNRMAPNTAAAFALIGLSLLLLYGGRRIKLAQGLALFVGWIALLTIIGYGFSVRSFSKVLFNPQMAFNTGVGFLILSAGLLASRSSKGLVAIVTGPGPGGILSRRLLPVAVVLPILLGGLRAEGERRGLYPLAFGIALMVITTISLLVILILATARFVDRAQEKQALDQEAVRKISENEIQRFFDVSLDMLCVSGFDGYFKRLNASWETDLGFSREQLMEKPFVEFVHPDDRDATAAASSGLATGQNVVSFTNRFLCADGSYRWLQWNAGSDMSLGRIFGAAHDVTEIRHSQEEVRNLNAKLEARVRDLRAANRFAVFGSEVGTALTRSDSLKDSLDRCAQAMVDQLDASIASIWVLDEKKGMLDLAGAAGAPSADNVLPESRAQVAVGQHRIGRIARDGKPQLVSLETDPAQDDDKRWARDHGMVSFAGLPLIVRARTVGVISMFASHELTEASLLALASVADRIAVGIDRMHALEALAATEARTRAILDNMLGGLITADAHARIQSANPAAEKMFGYGPGALNGKHLSVLIPLADTEDLKLWLREATMRALGKITEWKARRSDGTRFDIELGLFPFQTPDGWNFAGHVADISHRLDVGRLKAEFVSTVSHELRTPLTSIRGSLGLLAAGVLGEMPEEAKEILAVAERNVVRLVTLINDILDLDRLDSGRLEMHFARVPVTSVIGQAIESVKALAEQHGITIECTATEGTLYADSDRLVQVLVNLLSNAVKFSPPKSTISVSVIESKGTTEIRVQDRGRGVPLELRAAIFERFRQVESSDSREKGGTGLGLAICKAIVEQHGGKIGVESGDGGGSVFWIRLFAPVTRPTLTEGDSVAIARASVLLVEDDPALASVLSRQLKAKGVAVRVAATGRATLVQVRDRPPDLIVLDIDVPEGDGYFIVEELRKYPGGILPLLVYSGSDLVAKERDRLLLGPTRFLTKSRSTDQEFLDVVLEMLAESQEKALSAK